MTLILKLVILKTFCIKGFTVQLIQKQHKATLGEVVFASGHNE